MTAIPADILGLGPKKIRDYYAVDTEQLIGEGAFAQVFYGQRLADSGDVAIKVIDKRNVGTRISSIRSEIELLLAVDFPYIVQCHDVYEDEHKVYLVMDLLEGGDLYQRITEQYPSGMSERQAAVLIKKLCLTVQYLHANGIIHRDLKPENILFVDEYDDTDVRLTDFGLARLYDDEMVIRTMAGSPTYVAPEILSQRTYTPAVDMWSLGVITYVTVSCKAPFSEDTIVSLSEKIVSGVYEMPAEPFAQLSEACKAFIRSLLVVDPTERATAGAALAHPWLADVVV